MKKIALFIFIICLSITAVQSANKTFIRIGTAGVGGVYYTAGSAICRIVNKSNLGIKCTIEGTSASVYNLNAVRNGELEFGIAQSDWHYHAYKGTNKFKKQGPDKKLRSVFSLHEEAFSIITHPESKIFKFEDILSKKINIGAPGSGTRATMDTVMKLMNWKEKDFKILSGLKAAEQSSALCDKNIDAFIYIVGHPQNTVMEAVTVCGARLVDVSQGLIDNITGKYPYYIPTNIDKNFYKTSFKPTSSFGMNATFVTSLDVDEETVYNLTKTVFENLDYIRNIHVSLQNLDRKFMVKYGNMSPFHPGALKYYKEAGFIKDE